MNQKEFFDVLLKSQWWSPREIQDFQQKRLMPLLHHAHQTVPFYRFRLEKMVSRLDRFDWDEWLDFPILTRADLSKYQTQLYAKSFPIAHGPAMRVSTSGSTGHPITMLTTRWLIDLARACAWRFHLWHDLDWSKRLLRRSYKIIDGMSDGDVLGPWGPPWDTNGKKGREHYFSYQTSIELFFDYMTREKPEYVFIYAQSIDILAQLALERRQTFKVRSFMSRGEAVSDRTRKLAQDAFDAPILEIYSSQECGVMATPCETGEGLHICSEAALVEIVKDDGKLAKEGEEGRIIVTNFSSTATPLIRYDQGDRAIMGGRCSCGRGLPLIKKILGRTHHAFQHPDGRTEFGPKLESGRSILSAQRWQVTQTGPVNYNVHFSSEVELNDDAEQKFRAFFKDMIFEDSIVDIIQVTEAYFNRDPKFQEYRKTWDTDSHPNLKS